MIRLDVANVLGKEYKVTYPKDIGDAVGHVNPYPPAITIWDGLDEYEILSTTLHEVIHALDELLNLSLSESKVCCLSVGLADFLTRNGIIKL